MKGGDEEGRKFEVGERRRPGRDTAVDLERTAKTWVT